MIHFRAGFFWMEMFSTKALVISVLDSTQLNQETLDFTKSTQ